MKTIIEKRILLGVLFLLAGTVLLFEYYNIIPLDIPSYLISWKSFLFGLGVYFLITSKEKTTGLILITISTVLITGEVFDMGFWEVVRLIIPLVLIIAGLSIIMHKQAFSSRQINVPAGENVNDYINETNIFSGGEKQLSSHNFKGGTITSIFGGSELDMRLSKMAPGVNSIDLLCIFGGNSLKVPEDWEVKIDVNAIFGGFSDSRKLEKKEFHENPEKVLHIKGLVLFGGGEILT
jgi:predicted membrane protein